MERISSTTREYHVWYDMIRRCTNPDNKNFSRYGGRGIRVCERWLSFVNFLSNMGRRPSPLHTIERIDNDGDYEPCNARWATRTEQQQNTCQARLIEHDGQRLSLSAWARQLGMVPSTLRQRIKRHGVEIALSTARQPHGRKISSRKSSYRQFVEANL